MLLLIKCKKELKERSHERAVAYIRRRRSGADREPAPPESTAASRASSRAASLLTVPDHARVSRGSKCSTVLPARRKGVVFTQ